MIGIYKITNVINHKIYIGQSKDIKRRWQQHIRASQDINHSSYFNPLYVDFRKYGIENFQFEICETIENYDKKKLDALELFYMKKYDTLKSGYNIQATSGQKIALLNNTTSEIKFFVSFAQVEDWLRRNHYTSGRHLKPFLSRAIKQKTLIYDTFYIYYWKE